MWHTRVVAWQAVSGGVLQRQLGPFVRLRVPGFRCDPGRVPVEPDAVGPNPAVLEVGRRFQTCFLGGTLCGGQQSYAHAKGPKHGMFFHKLVFFDFWFSYLGGHGIRMQGWTCFPVCFIRFSGILGFPAWPESFRSDLPGPGINPPLRPDGRMMSPERIGFPRIGIFHGPWGRENFVKTRTAGKKDTPKLQHAL